MKRSEGLVTLSRREVCTGLAGCLGIAIVASCGGDSGAPVDAPADSKGSGSGGACGTGATDVGAPSTFMMNKPVYFSSVRVFVVRDAGGLYALTARCTHEGTTTVIQTNDFYCPNHGAMFDFTGAVTRGPAITPLQHYAMCILPNGNVGVNTSMPVDKTVRLSA